MNKNTKPIGTLSDAEISELKSNNEKIFTITCADNDGKKHICYVRKPTKDDLSYACNVNQRNTVLVGNLLLSNCWLKGSEAIKNNDEMWVAASTKMLELFQIKEAELGEL